MVKFVQIMKKNLKSIFRDKKNFLFLLLFPILYYCVIGIISGGIQSNSASAVYIIGWVDLDSSESGNPNLSLDSIYQIIDQTDMITLRKYQTNESAKSALEMKEIEGFVIIPQGYELYLNKTGPFPQDNLTFYFRDSSNEITRNIITSTIAGILSSIVNYNPNTVPIYYIEKSISGNTINQITQNSPGALMYGILSALTGAIVILTSERKEGLLKRLESTRIKPADMIIGHFCSNTAVVLIQFIVGIITLSLFGFHPLFFNIISLLIGILLAVILLSFFQNALAMIASAVLKSPEAAGGGIWILLIPLMMFSGAFFPLELVMPNVIPYIGWIPTRIAVVIFQDIMINTVPFWDQAVLLNFLWLFVESAVLFILGTFLYRKFAHS